MITKNLLLDIALTHLYGRVRQTVISIIGVALGVGFFIAMAAMMEGFQGFFTQKIIDVSPHIVMEDEFRERPRQPVSWFFGDEDTAIALQGIKPKEEIRGIKNAERIIKALADTPGLRIAPTLDGQVFYRYGSTDVSSSLKGIEPKNEKQITKLEDDIILGSLDALMTHSYGIILGSALADELNAKLGDTLTGISVAGIVKKMKVVGIFHTGITELDKNVSYTLLKDAQVLHNRPNVINSIRFSMSDPDKAEAFARTIEERYKYKSVSWQEANEGILSVFVIQDTIRYATTGAILLVACFGIFNIISTVINEKSRDIAILKSMGFTESDIQRIFIFQGVLIGLVGMIIGWALGYGLSVAMASVKIKMEAIITSEHLFIVYDIMHYVWGGIACMVAATVAAWLPARKASLMRPVDIVRGAAG